MSHDDKFPPNRFLKKYMTPGRTILGVLGFFVLELVGAKYFPHQLQFGAMILLMIWIPMAIGLMIWFVVWTIRHPAPPRDKCPNCHQLMPEKDDE